MTLINSVDEMKNSMGTLNSRLTQLKIESVSLRMRCSKPLGNSRGWRGLGRWRDLKTAQGWAREVWESDKFDLCVSM